MPEHKPPTRTIPADGSERLFFRTTWKGLSAVEIHPAPGESGLAEARSFHDIGRHLKNADVPVPEIYHYDSNNGVITVEYLGDALLNTRVKHLISHDAWPEVFRLYRQALAVLIQMQTDGAAGFNNKWCFDSPRYDAGLAYRNEVLYFLRSFVRGFLQYDPSPAVEQELSELACRVNMIEERDFFLHRDFQSRNIMIKEDKLHIIDFQGGRSGPMGYDAASLILDPYVGLPGWMRAELLAFYMKLIKDRNPSADMEKFPGEFRLLGLMRTLQVLGAYSFLSMTRRKHFFLQFIAPALSNLIELAFHRDFDDLIEFRQMVQGLSIDQGGKNAGQG